MDLEDVRPRPRESRAAGGATSAHAYSSWPVNSITCWKVERLVQLIVKDMYGSGGKWIRTSGARQRAGSEPWEAESCSAAAWITPHSDARQAVRLPPPQYCRL